jgi:hypothetical protein
MHEAPPHPIVRFRRLDPGRRRLLARACVTLSVASAMVALLPFRRAVRFGCVPLGKKGPDADECIWAIEAAARRLPWRAMCIEQGLAAQRMLRRGGLDAVLHYGIRQPPPSGKLEAHVWVSVGGKAVIGGEAASGYAEVATFS